MGSFTVCTISTLNKVNAAACQAGGLDIWWTTTVSGTVGVEVQKALQRCLKPLNSFPQRLFEPLRCASQVRLPALGNMLAVHSLSDVRNERNNAALHKAEIAVPSHKAAEIE
jgi:hypothetical protein